MTTMIPEGAAPRPAPYSAVAKFFHWTVAALVIVTIPIGLVMAERGRADLFDATTNNLYSTHKLIGLTILTLMVARLLYRLTAGAPPPSPTLSTAQRLVSSSVHWLFYVLLIATAIGGWLGISYFGALDAFGIKIPALVDKNEDMAKQIFVIHAIAAYTIIGLIGLHLAGALFHLIVARDGVFGRMWPGSSSRNG